MKKLILTLFLVTALLPRASYADSKFMDTWWWWWNHWDEQDFNPYYDNSTDPHNNSYVGANWNPDVWIKASGGDGKKLIERWEQAGILGEHDLDLDDIPYLEVGDNFYHLSGYDKRRVMETFDRVEKISANKPGLFYVKDPKTKKIIGYFNKDGLNLE